MMQFYTSDPVTPEQFRAKRRQKFLNLEYYILNQNDLNHNIQMYLEEIQNKKSDDSSASLEYGLFGDSLDLLKLHYTAGVPIDELKPYYDKVIAALKVWNEAYVAYIKSLEDYPGELPYANEATPLFLEDLARFQLVMDVASLGLLLGDGKALRQLTDWCERYRHCDMVFEELVSPAIPDPDSTCDNFYHEFPYTYLIDAFLAKTPEKAIDAMNQYLSIWYKSFEGDWEKGIENAPWHNGHLNVVDGEYMSYYGYWAFEAAAIAVLHNIDDTSFRDHLLYPKDLADWARANKSIEKVRASLKDDIPPSVPGGNPCPRAGRWATPAQVGSARDFKEGEIMPDFESDYGMTIWQWCGPSDDGKVR